MFEDWEKTECMYLIIGTILGYAMLTVRWDTEKSTTLGSFSGHKACLSIQNILIKVYIVFVYC